LGVLLYVVVVMTGVFFALGVLGLDKTLTSLLAGAGIIGLALGLAFQDMGANLLSGIYMSIERPFRTGHLIKSNDYFGTVERISLRQTEILTPEGQLVLIPNKKIFENPIINFSATSRRRVDIPVGVSYADDLEHVKQIAIAALRELPSRDPSRDVELYYDEFGESSINFVVRFWISFARQPDFLQARSEAIERIKNAFDANEITIPFPIRTIEFSKVPPPAD
jgi:small conductance mechanosensitive channel